MCSVMLVKCKYLFAYGAIFANTRNCECVILGCKNKWWLKWKAKFYPHLKHQRETPNWGSIIRSLNMITCKSLPYKKMFIRKSIHYQLRLLPRIQIFIHMPGGGAPWVCWGQVCKYIEAWENVITWQTCLHLILGKTSPDQNSQPQQARTNLLIQFLDSSDYIVQFLQVFSVSLF